MKKQIEKLSLSRETLHRLEIKQLRQAAAGVWTHPPVCETTGNC